MQAVSWFIIIFLYLKCLLELFCGDGLDDGVADVLKVSPVLLVDESLKNKEEKGTMQKGRQRDRAMHKHKERQKV